MPSKRLAVVCMAICSSPGIATAQEESMDMFYQMSLEELMQVEIHSASKTTQTIKDIPAQVTLITRQDINNYGFSSLTDILRNLPGLYVEEDTEETYIGTRGAINGGILFLINGIPQHPALQKGLSTVETNRLNIPVAAIDRIEFIHGPMSVIYGNNAFQGTLNIITHEQGSNQLVLAAAHPTGGEAFVRAGHRFTEGNLGINLSRSQQAGFSGAYKDMMSDAQLAELTAVNPTSMDGHFKRDLQSLDAWINWKGWSAGINYQESEYPLYPATPPINNNLLRLTTWQVNIKHQGDLTHQWQALTTLVASRDKYEIDAFSIISPELFGFQQQGADRLEFEQNLVYQPNKNESLLLGYRYQQIHKIHNRFQIGFVDPGDINNAATQLDNIALQDIFAQWQRPLGEQWSLVAGLRYSLLPEHYRLTDRANFPDISVTQTHTDDRNLLNYRFALMYQLNEHHQFKLLHGTAAQDVEAIEFAQPKEIETSEIVHVFDNKKWMLSQSLYYNNVDHVARRYLNFNGNQYIATFLNDGRWKTQGYELNTEYRINAHWRISGALDLQSTEDRNSDLEVGYSPKTLFKIKTDYQQGKHIWAAYAHYVTSRTSDWHLVDTDGDNQLDTQTHLGETARAYWNLNANWRYQITQAMNINLNISNLLDNGYRYPSNEVSTLERGLIAEGRVITASISWAY